MTEEELEIEVISELKIQAMIFDMDIDYEALALIPKRKDNTPVWIKRWNEKRAEADFDELIDIDRE